MSEDEFKNAMTKTVIFIVIMIIILIIIGIFIFNKSGKETSVFTDNAQKQKYEDMVEENNPEDLNDVNEIEGINEFGDDTNDVAENEL